MALVSKDEPLATSMPQLGYLILRELEGAERNRISLTTLMSKLRKRGVTQYRPIMFALMFLYATGAIEFKAPYVYRM